MEEKCIAYKGFDKDLKCRGFQYEVGKEYETDEAVACEMPLAVLNCYPPATSRYCLVEQSGEMDAHDGKTASMKLKVCAEIGIPGLVKEQIEWVWKHARSEKSASGYQSVASTSGDRSVASASGDRSVASNSGKASVAMASGIDGRVKGAVGCALFAVERGGFDGEAWPIQSVASAIVDGEVIKADTWYWCRNWKLVEVDEDAR